MNWEIEFLTDWDKIFSHDFQKDWLTWCNIGNDSHVFYHPTFIKSWVETYIPIRRIKPLFCLARKGESLIFFPLVLWSMNWRNAFLQKVIPAGYADFDYHDPIIVGNVSINEYNIFWRDLFLKLSNNRSIDTVLLQGIRSNSISSALNFEEQDLCPYLDLASFNNDESKFIASLKSNLRGDINRQLRRLKEIGEIKYEVFKVDSSNISEQLDLLLNYHSLKWPNAYKAPGFHKNLISNAMPYGLIHFSTLTVNNVNISWHLGFKFRRRFYYYMPVSNPLYSNYSPGKLLLFYLNCDAIKNGVILFDHLRGVENYKQGWTSQMQSVYIAKWISNRPSSKLKNGLVNLKDIMFLKKS